MRSSFVDECNNEKWVALTVEFSSGHGEEEAEEEQRGGRGGRKE